MILHYTIKNEVHLWSMYVKHRYLQKIYDLIDYNNWRQFEIYWQIKAQFNIVFLVQLKETEGSMKIIYRLKLV